MSTLASADLGPSDDEEDTDFVPQASKRTTAKKTKRRRSQSPSDGDSQSSDSDDDAEQVEDTESKRLKLDQEEAEAAEARRRAAETFAAMKQSAVAPKVEAAPKVEVKLVEVKRPRRFAGETLYETVMLPADDPEAVEYLKKSEGVSPALKDTEGMEAKSGESNPPTAAGPSVANQAKKPTGKGPPRRKPRQSLEQMSAALDKGKKMTTLEKSAMDWKALTAGDAQLADELEANRRGGGYVEKQDFLDRVGERRADSQQKPTQRRT